MKAIAAYVARLDAASCPRKPERTTLYSAMSDARRALFAAENALSRGDAKTADFLLLAARGELGRVHQRMPGEGLAAERAALTDLSAAISALREAAQSDPKAALAATPALLDRFNDVFAFVHHAKKKTLFERKELARWLEAQAKATH